MKMTEDSHIKKNNVEKVEDILNSICPDGAKYNKKMAFMWCSILDWLGIDKLVAPNDPVFSKFQGCRTDMKDGLAIMIPKNIRNRKKGEPIQKSMNITDNNDKITEWKVFKITDKISK